MNTRPSPNRKRQGRHARRAHIALLWVAPALVHAQQAPPAVAADAPERIEVTGHYDNAVGSSDAASQGVIGSGLLKSRPAQRPGEVLEFVPGMIVTQHSGDGKANQYFLRGFNLDHGTDFATTVNGVPVNMPSHAHGQGYSDLNFLMPELVRRIDYRKGPYFADYGDFAAAGAADIAYRTRLDTPFADLSIGQRGYRRGVLGGSTEVAEGVTLLGAFEGLRNDGPWTVPEDLRKHNAVLTLSGGTPASAWQASVMGYGARWTATDQVPQRLIDAGTYNGQPFGRYDTLDDSTGGESHRHSLSGEWSRQVGDQRTRIAAYAMRYDLKLYSNFTYFSTGPQGDQFLQQDARKVFGLEATHALSHNLGGLDARTEFGLQLRQDRAQVGLFGTARRAVLNTVREDDVRETLTGVYAQTNVAFTPLLRAVVGVRADQANFRVDSRSLAANSGNARDTLVSPKLSLVAGPLHKTEAFFNIGRGFHSNDARGTTARIDPATGDPVNPVPGLVPATGAEVGLRTEALPGLQSSLALWALRFDSELVYVGDAGATEPNSASRRRGMEWNNRWVPVPWFLLDADLAWTHARFENGERIPLAVDRVASVSATVRELGPWSASLQLRYLGPAALIEDNSVRSKPAATLNLRVARKLGSQAELTLDVFNLTDRKVDDIQYFYASQLPGETAPVDDLHVHPAEPRSVRVSLRLGW